MSVRAKKKPSRRRKSSPGVTIESFSTDCFVEFTDSDTLEPKTSKKQALNDASATSVQDRRYLRDMEIWLNNCVNFAQRLEGKEAAKILRLLTEARERTIRLRG